MILSRAVIIVVFSDSRCEGRLLGLIKKYARVDSIHYLCEDDKNGWPQIRVAVYKVFPKDTRLLRSSLSNFENSRGCEIIIRGASPIGGVDLTGI
ncbi:MAG: hypothetical protein ABIJ47_06995 [Candidatus Bathyarchaeota archaeon]